MFNPLACVKHFFNKKIKEIEENTDKDSYTKEEVQDIIRGLQKVVYTSIKSSSFIFDINEEQEVCVDDISVTKLLVDKNKYVLFIRCTNEQIENDMFIKRLKEYKNKHDYVVDIVIVDYETDIELVTAKLDCRETPFDDLEDDEEVVTYVRGRNRWSPYAYNYSTYDYINSSTTNYTFTTTNTFL